MVSVRRWIGSILLMLVLVSFHTSVSATHLNRFDRRAQAYLNRSETYLRRNLDSADFFLSRAYRLRGKLGSVLVESRLYLQRGELYKERGELVRALEDYLRSAHLLDEAVRTNPGSVEYKLQWVDSWLKIGTIYIRWRSYDKSIACFEKALRGLKEIRSKQFKQEVDLRKLKVFNNIAAVYLQKENYDTALSYFDHALKSEAAKTHPEIVSSLYNNRGICYLEKQELDLANHYFQQALDSRKKMNDFQGQAQTLNNIGKVQVLTGKTFEAKETFTRSLVLSRRIGSKESALISLESLASIHESLGNYKESLHYFKAYKSLNDSMFNAESRLAIARLEEGYKRQDQQRKIELLRERRLARELQENIRFYVLILLLISASLLVLVLRGRVRNARLQQDKLVLEKEKMALERNELEEDLEMKNKELVANSLLLVQHNALINRVTDTLQTIKPSLKPDNLQVVQDLLRDLKGSKNPNLWEEFEWRFTRIHTQFYPALQEQFPNLTLNERKLCAFLRLNMSTKDISEITGQSVNSITVARSRLRKKLNIEGEEIQLIHFISQF